MQLQHTFTLPVGVDEAWQILRDLGAVAPSMPGSTVASAAPDAVEGALKVKLGPLNVTYKGAVRLSSADDATHVAVLAAEGTSARSGSATATVTATLASDGDATAVTLDTELELTGKPAQFGQSVMSDVGTKLVGQFAAALSEAIISGSLAPAPSAPAEPVAPVAPDPAAELDPVELADAPADEEPADAPADEAVAADDPVVEPEPAQVFTGAFATGSAPDRPDPIPSANGHGAPAPQPTGRRDVVGSVAAVARPALVRGVAPLAIAAVFVFGAFRRRRGRRRR